MKRKKEPFYTCVIVFKNKIWTRYIPSRSGQKRFFYAYEGDNMCPIDNMPMCIYLPTT